jgi:hypothetical protein
MSDGEITRNLQLQEETIVVPHSDTPVHTGIVVPVRTNLDGAYEPAQLAFARAVQDYAQRLAIESANQEISERAPGVDGKEITESAVVRARGALDKKMALQVRKRSRLDPYALAGSPIFSTAAGVMGTFLHSPRQVVIFCVLAVVAIACILHVSTRRMQ